MHSCQPAATTHLPQAGANMKCGCWWRHVPAVLAVGAQDLLTCSAPRASAAAASRRTPSITPRSSTSLRRVASASRLRSLSWASRVRSSASQRSRLACFLEDSCGPGRGGRGRAGGWGWACHKGDPRSEAVGRQSSSRACTDTYQAASAHTTSLCSPPLAHLMYATTT